MHPLPGRFWVWTSPPFAWTALRLLDSPPPGAERPLPRRSSRAEWIRVALRHPSALVLDLDDHAAVILAAGPERDASARGRGLEGVLQQVHQRRREELRVDVDCERGITRLRS